MGAGGPEMHAESQPEPVDAYNKTLNEHEKTLNEHDALIDKMIPTVGELPQLLADRVEEVAEASKDEAGKTMQRTHEYLLDQVEVVAHTIQMLLGETKSIHQETRRNLQQQREVDITDPRAQQLLEDGSALSKMSSRIGDMKSSQFERMFGVGEALDAGLEDQEGTGRSETWRKTEGGAPENAQVEEGSGEKEKQEKYVPTPSVEKNMGDLVLAMKIANSEAPADEEVDGPAAFKALSAEFSAMEPAQQEAFVAWANAQIEGRPYEASKDDLSGTLRFDRTA